MRPSSVTETRDALGLALQLGDFARHFAGRPVRDETLDVNPVLGNIAIEQSALGRVHHRARTADEPAVHLRSVRDQMGDRLLAARTVEHAVEQFDVLLLGVEKMVELEPAEMLSLSAASASRKITEELSRLP